MLIVFFRKFSNRILRALHARVPMEIFLRFSNIYLFTLILFAKIGIFFDIS